MATIQIEVSDSTAARFTELTAADRQRIDAEIKEILFSSLPRPESLERNPKVEDPMLALFQQWEEEDAHMTPEEIAKEQRDFETFKANINAERDRAGARRVF